jgi:hypothetical protein
LAFPLHLRGAMQRPSLRRRLVPLVVVVLSGCSAAKEALCEDKTGQIAPSSAGVGSSGSVEWTDGAAKVTCAVPRTVTSSELSAPSSDPNYRCTFFMDDAFSLRFQVLHATGGGFDRQFNVYMTLPDVRRAPTGALALDHVQAYVAVPSPSSEKTDLAPSESTAIVRRAVGEQAPAPDFVTSDFERDIDLDLEFAGAASPTAAVHLSLSFVRASFTEGTAPNGSCDLTGLK